VYVDESNTEGTFRFIHMYGAHPPYTMTSDFQYKPFDGKRDVHNGNMLSQAIGSMKIVYEYISQLQELGKYDDATIIITADHGHNTELYDDEGNITGISVPIMFIKKSGETSEVIKESSAPVSHEDLMPTIEKAAGIAVGERTIDDITEDEDRTRIFRICKDEIYRKYEIIGDVYDINNWKLVFER
jgi:predicted AlkP superfamily pyrophosphatase or phosphodiesterase